MAKVFFYPTIKFRQTIWDFYRRLNGILPYIRYCFVIFKQNSYVWCLKWMDFKKVQLYFLKNTIKDFIRKSPFFRVMFARWVDGALTILITIVRTIFLTILITIFLTIFWHIKNSDEIHVGVLLLYEKVFKNLWVLDSQKFFKIYFCEKVF